MFFLSGAHSQTCILNGAGPVWKEFSLQGVRSCKSNESIRNERLCFAPLFGFGIVWVLCCAGYHRGLAVIRSTSVRATTGKSQC